MKSSPFFTTPVKGALGTPGPRDVTPASPAVGDFETGIMKLLPQDPTVSCSACLRHWTLHLLLHSPAVGCHKSLSCYLSRLWHWALSLPLQDPVAARMSLAHVLLLSPHSLDTLIPRYSSRMLGAKAL